MPSPRRTPAATWVRGEPRLHAHSPRPVRATAARSQFVTRCNSNTGEAATITASHTRRRPASLATVQVDTSAQPARISAVISKKVVLRSSCPSAGWLGCTAFVTSAATNIRPPRIGGYSTGWSR
jgi:hypothetical protein